MNTNPEYLDIAREVLQHCSGYDLWFPTPSQTAIVAWANVFATSKLSREDLIAGVDRAYQTEAPGYRPLPASIISYARTAYFEALRNLPDDRRRLMDEANYALQDIGFSTNEAHRYSRAVALGRVPSVQLTNDQADQLRARLARTREQLEQPPRHLEPLWKVLREATEGPQQAFRALTSDSTEEEDAA
ncbi:hypothetical protein [Nocardia ignorata]|uniref:Uncharacterized protein n=1 Tax=Nocardia ignorata TaxID=145285 RepID=A0A4R6P0T8_NOCIG|nr:hypothetical protein [Nocardia ignorata]TDP29892.1 hypothetical protein DFR75_112161 [Nocardia ignorata]